VQPPIGAHGAEIRLRLQEIVDCPHETGETGIAYTTSNKIGHFQRDRPIEQQSP
jgi:hypothetical protein